MPQSGTITPAGMLVCKEARVVHLCARLGLQTGPSEVQVDTEQHTPQGLLWNNSVFVRLCLLDEQDVGSRHKESVWPCSLFATG